VGRKREPPSVVALAVRAHARPVEVVSGPPVDAESVGHTKLSATGAFPVRVAISPDTLPPVDTAATEQRGCHGEIVSGWMTVEGEGFGLGQVFRNEP
jgi:hypothetical protein